MTKSNQILCVGTSQENKRAESPLVALTLPPAATRPSLSALGPEPLKDPWLSAPCSRGVWPYRIFQTVADQGKGLCLKVLVHGLLSWDLYEAMRGACSRPVQKSRILQKVTRPEMRLSPAIHPGHLARLPRSCCAANLT